MKDRRKRTNTLRQIGWDWRAGKGQNTSRCCITYAKASPNHLSLAKTRQKNRLTDARDVWHALYMATNRLGIRQYRLMVNLTTDQELTLTRLSARATNERGRMVSRSEIIRELIDKASSVLDQPLQTTTVQPMQFGDDDPSNPLG